MRTIDKAEAIALVMKYAEAEPNKVVECRYVDYDSAEPECIVGQILVNDLGVPAEKLLENTNRIGTAITDELSEVGVELTPQAFMIFDMAQSVQDGRKHYALRAVDPYIPMASDEANEILNKYGYTWGDAGRFVTEFADKV